MAQILNGLAKLSTKLECVFALNSPAGCRFKILSQATGNITSIKDINASKVNEWTAIIYVDLGIPEGNYDVHVYDTVDGEVKAIPAIKLKYIHTSKYLLKVY